MMLKYYSLTLFDENYGLIFEQSSPRPTVDFYVYRLNGRQRQALTAAETTAFWSAVRQQYPEESMDAFSASDIDPRITIINTMVHLGVAVKEPLPPWRRPNTPSSYKKKIASKEASQTLQRFSEKNQPRNKKGQFEKPKKVAKLAQEAGQAKYTTSSFSQRDVKQILPELYSESLLFDLIHVTATTHTIDIKTAKLETKFHVPEIEGDPYNIDESIFTTLLNLLQQHGGKMSLVLKGPSITAYAGVEGDKVGFEAGAVLGGAGLSVDLPNGSGAHLFFEAGISAGFTCGSVKTKRGDKVGESTKTSFKIGPLSVEYRPAPSSISPPIVSDPILLQRTPPTGLLPKDCPHREIEEASYSPQTFYAAPATNRPSSFYSDGSGALDLDSKEPVSMSPDQLRQEQYRPPLDRADPAFTFVAEPVFSPMGAPPDVYLGARQQTTDEWGAERGQISAGVTFGPDEAGNIRPKGIQLTATASDLPGLKQLGTLMAIGAVGAVVYKGLQSYLNPHPFPGLDENIPENREFARAVRNAEDQRAKVARPKLRAMLPKLWQANPHNEQTTNTLRILAWHLHPKNDNESSYFTRGLFNDSDPVRRALILNEIDRQYHSCLKHTQKSIEQKLDQHDYEGAYAVCNNAIVLFPGEGFDGHYIPRIRVRQENHLQFLEKTPRQIIALFESKPDEGLRQCNEFVAKYPETKARFQPYVTALHRDKELTSNVLYTASRPIQADNTTAMQQDLAAIKNKQYQRVAYKQAAEAMEEQRAVILDQINLVQQEGSLTAAQKNSVLTAHCTILLQQENEQFKLAVDWYHCNPEDNKALHLCLQRGISTSHFAEIKTIIQNAIGPLGENFTEKAQQRLTMMKVLIGHMGLQKDAQQCQFAIKTLEQMQLSHDKKCSNQERALTEVLLGQLEEADAVINFNKAAKHYENALTLDPNPQTTIHCANLMCRQLRFAEATAAIRQCDALSDEEKQRQTQLIADKKINTILFYAQLGLKGIRFVGQQLIASKSLDLSDADKQKIELLIEGTAIAGCAIGVAQAYRSGSFLSLTLALAHGVLQAQASYGKRLTGTAQSEFYMRLEKQYFTLDAVQSTAEIFQSAAELIRSSSTDVVTDSVLDTAATASSSAILQALSYTKIFSIPLSFAKRHYFDDWRRKGEAPTSFVGIVAEDITWAADKGLTAIRLYETAVFLQPGAACGLFMFSNSVALAGKVVAVELAAAPGAALSGAAAASDATWMILGGKTLVAFQSTTCATVNIGGTAYAVTGTVILGATAAVAAVACTYAAYRYYHYRQYQNALHNNQNHFTQCLADFQNRAAHLGAIRKNLIILSKNYPKDMHTLIEQSVVDLCNELEKNISDINPKKVRDLLDVSSQTFKQSDWYLWEKDVSCSEQQRLLPAYLIAKYFFQKRTEMQMELQALESNTQISPDAGVARTHALKQSLNEINKKEYQIYKNNDFFTNNENFFEHMLDLAKQINDPDILTSSRAKMHEANPKLPREQMKRAELHFGLNASAFERSEHIHAIEALGMHDDASSTKKATTQYYLGYLKQDAVYFERTDVVEHYRNAVDFDPSLSEAAASYANELLIQMRYANAQNTLEQCRIIQQKDLEEFQRQEQEKSALGSKEFSAQINQRKQNINMLEQVQQRLEVRRMNAVTFSIGLGLEYGLSGILFIIDSVASLLGTMKSTTDQATSTSASSKRDYIRHRARLMQPFLNVLKSTMDLYKQWWFYQRLPMTISSEVLGQERFHLTTGGATLFLQLTAVLRPHTSNPHAEYFQSLDRFNLFIDLTKTLCASSLFLSQWREARDLVPQLILLASFGMSVAPFVHQHHMMRNRQLGHAPTTVGGIIVEDAVWIFCHPKILMPLALYQNRQSVFDLIGAALSRCPREFTFIHVLFRGLDRAILQWTPEQLANGSSLLALYIAQHPTATSVVKKTLLGIGFLTASFAIYSYLTKRMRDNSEHNTRVIAENHLIPAEEEKEAILALEDMAQRHGGPPCTQASSSTEKKSSLQSNSIFSSRKKPTDDQMPANYKQSLCAIN